MLNEHLDHIYISEDINTILAQIKSKSKSIVDAASNGNILKLNQVFSTMPAISSDQLKSITSKKISKEYKESEKYVSSKINKAPEEIKNIIIVARATLNNIKSQRSDSEIVDKLDETLEKIDNVIANIANSSLSNGVSLILIASILSMFVGTAPLIVSLIATGGTIGLLSAIFLYTISLLLRIFIEAKKAGQKVIK